MYSTLQQIFPTDEIIKCSGETATCDYKIHRHNENKPTILIENKDYSRSVTTDEVVKFERDLSIQHYHGIFISQSSSITFKYQFQIDIKCGLIHVYIPNAHYNVEKIKVGVDIIDALSDKLINIETNKQDNSIHIDMSEIEDIMREYSDFNLQKHTIIDSIKLNNKLLLENIDKLQFSVIHKLLIKHKLIDPNENLTCKYCNTFTGKNKTGLNAHIRNCKSNNKPNEADTMIKTNSV